jgi:hypothetical protein
MDFHRVFLSYNSGLPIIKGFFPVFFFEVFFSPNFGPLVPGSLGAFSVLTILGFFVRVIGSSLPS